MRASGNSGRVSHWALVFAFMSGIVAAGMILVISEQIRAKDPAQVYSPGVASYVDEVQAVLGQIVETRVWGRLEGSERDDITIQNIRVRSVKGGSVKMECRIYIEGNRRPYMLHVHYDTVKREVEKLAFAPFPYPGIARKAMDRARELAVSDQGKLREMLSAMAKSIHGMPRDEWYVNLMVESLFARPSSEFIEKYHPRHSITGIYVQAEIIPRNTTEKSFLVVFDPHGNMTDVVMFAH